MTSVFPDVTVKLCEIHQSLFPDMMVKLCEIHPVTYGNNKSIVLSKLGNSLQGE